MSRNKRGVKTLGTVKVDAREDADLKEVAKDAMKRHPKSTKAAEALKAAKEYQPRTWHNDKDKPYLGPNDIKWRTNTRLTFDSGNIPFGTPLGLDYDRIDQASLDYLDSAGNSIDTVIPGVMGIGVALTLGTCTDYNSPFNLAVRKSYSWIRHANSGSKNYEANDLGLYYGAVGQALGMLSWLKRIYVHALDFSPTNRYLPRSLLYMDGVDPTDITANLPQLLYLINWLSSAINSLAFPKMPYFEMCAEQFLHVYKDSESPKEQLYMYIPKVFAKYVPNFDANGGGLSYKASDGAFIPNASTFATINAGVHSIMDVLLGDEDIGIISGDILKAYGEDRFFVRRVEVGEIATPIYSLEVLEQIHNVVVANGAPLETYSQKPGVPGAAPYLYSNYGGQTFTVTGGSDAQLPSGAKIIIDAFGKEPTPEEVFNCCILKCNLRYSATYSAGVMTVTTTRTDHDCILPTTIQYIKGAIGSVLTLSTGASSAWYVAIGNIGTDIMSMFIDCTNFDWSPVFQFFDVDGNDIALLGDIHNMTMVNRSQLIRIHEASTLSLFGFESNNF